MNKSKYSPEWVQNIKKLSLSLEKSKSDELAKLLTDQKKLSDEHNEKVVEIRKLESEKKLILTAASYQREAENEKKRLDDHKNTQEPRMANFLGTDYGVKTTVPTTNLWNTNGWLKKCEDHFTPADGKLDNVYKVKIGSSEVETTEEQVINTIACAIHALKKVDLADFTAKYDAKESDTNKRDKVKKYLTSLQKQEIIVGSDKDKANNAKQPSYDFAESYQKYDKSGNTWTAYTAPKFNYQEFFEFIELTHSQSFLSDLEVDKHKDVPESNSWLIFTKGEEWEVETLKDYGINIDSAKTTLYKTSETDSQTIAVGNGVAGWLELAYAITNEKDNLKKITEAFNNSPTQQLIDDLKTWKAENGFVTDKANLTLPESQDSILEVIDELSFMRSSGASEIAKLTKKINEAKKLKADKWKELSPKETAIDKIVKEILAKRREDLKTYHLEKGFEKTDSEDNRRTFQDLLSIQLDLLEISWLENGGQSNLPSSIANENTSLAKIKKLLAELVSNDGKCRWVNYFSNVLAFKADKDGLQDMDQAIKRIKDGKFKTADGTELRVNNDLKFFLEQFKEKEKIIKLSEWELEAKKEISKALGNPEDNLETLADWQTNLKGLDPLLVDTVITESKKKEFEAIDNFKKVAQVEGLLKKVIDNYQIKTEFVEVLKKQDADVDNLAKMLTKFEAEKCIKLILIFDYQKNLESTDQEERRRKYSWAKELKVDGKYVTDSEDYSISDDDQKLDGDFTIFLYELATGKKDLATITRPTTNGKDNGKEEKGLVEKYWPYGLGALAITAGLVALFWKKISAWFSGENEDESLTVEKIAETD